MTLPTLSKLTNQSTPLTSTYNFFTTSLLNTTSRQLGQGSGTRTSNMESSDEDHSAHEQDRDDSDNEQGAQLPARIYVPRRLLSYEGSPDLFRQRFRITVQLAQYLVQRLEPFSQDLEEPCTFHPRTSAELPSPLRFKQPLPQHKGHAWTISTHSVQDNEESVGGNLQPAGRAAPLS